MRLSVIVPTLGRETLAYTLASIKPQMQPGDEVVCVSDGQNLKAERLWHQANVPGRYRETAVTHDCGASQRNLALSLARGDVVLFMDDDDAYLPGSFAAIRKALAEQPVPHVFRMRYAAESWGHKPGNVLWRVPQFVNDNVSTQMLAYPNRPDLPRWDTEFGHDLRWAEAAAALFPAVVWHETVISEIRPGLKS